MQEEENMTVSPTDLNDGIPTEVCFYSASASIGSSWVEDETDDHLLEDHKRSLPQSSRPVQAEISSLLDNMSPEPRIEIIMGSKLVISEDRGRSLASPNQSPISLVQTGGLQYHDNHALQIKTRDFPPKLPLHPICEKKPAEFSKKKERWAFAGVQPSDGQNNHNSHFPRRKRSIDDHDDVPRQEEASLRCAEDLNDLVMNVGQGLNEQLDIFVSNASPIPRRQMSVTSSLHDQDSIVSDASPAIPRRQQSSGHSLDELDSVNSFTSPVAISRRRLSVASSNFYDFDSVVSDASLSVPRRQPSVAQSFNTLESLSSDASPAMPRRQSSVQNMRILDSSSAAASDSKNLSPLATPPKQDANQLLVAPQQEVAKLHDACPAVPMRNLSVARDLSKLV